MARRVISTQQDWQSVRGRFKHGSDYRAFSKSFSFNPSSTLRCTTLRLCEALPRSKPGGWRWSIFENAVVDGATVERVNELAAKVARREGGSREIDADIFIALFAGYATLEG